MAGVYPGLILCFCVYVMICAVAGENQDGNNRDERQGEEVNNIEDKADLITGDARVSPRKYTSTTQYTNSGMMTSALTKTVASFLSTSLPVSDGSQTKSLIADHGTKPPIFNNVKESRLDASVGEDIGDTSQSTLVDDTSQSTLVDATSQSTLVDDTSQSTLVDDTSQSTLVDDTSQSTLVDDTSQSTLVDDTSQLALAGDASQSTLTAQFDEMTESNLEEAGGVRQRDNVEEVGDVRQRENHEGTFRGVRQRDNLEETGGIQQRENHKGTFRGVRQRDNLDETEDIPQRDDLDETEGVRHSENLEEAEKSNHEETDYRNYLKEFIQRHPEETWQRQNLEDTEQRSNLTEDAISPNKVMKEINGSFDAENQTQTGEIMSNVTSAESIETTLPAIESYTRKRVTPTPAKEMTSRPELLAEKIKSRANRDSMPLILMWLLCLCRWIY